MSTTEGLMRERRQVLELKSEKIKTLLMSGLCCGACLKRAISPPTSSAPSLQKQSHRQLPLASRGDILRVPECGGRRGAQRASVWIINRDASDAFSRSPDRSNTLFIFTASFLLGGQRLCSFNLYICLCVWVKREHSERVCACASVCSCAFPSARLCVCVWISPLLRLIGVCAYLFEHNSIFQDMKSNMRGGLDK